MCTRRQFLGGGLFALFAVQYSELAEAAGTDKGDAISVREAIAARRTVRRYSDTMLREEQLMGLFRAAQGITDTDRGFRAVPSAGALYPLEIYAFLSEKAVTGRGKGLYRYRPVQGDTVMVGEEDLKEELGRACLFQMWTARAPVCLVIGAVYARSRKKYGDRGVRYSIIEAGCAAQNVFLMAESLGLGAGIVGAFDDEEVHRLLGSPEGCFPLLVMPVGYSG